MSQRRFHLPLLVVAALLLAGCYESPDVTRFEPGVYKGESDPLLAKSGNTAHQENLAERFDGQRDR
ncbi:MAG: hypothetical protein RQ729_00195 [Wenzhouxiangellaceae bacterium]|nr:hypothetical protein [Wenzhouxiangellaceae bacterium]